MSPPIIPFASRNPTIPPMVNKVRKRMAKWHTKPFKIEPDSTPNRAKMVARGGQEGQNIETQHRRNKEEGSILLRCPFVIAEVPSMAPIWVPRRNQHRKRTIPTSIKIDAFQDQFMIGCWWDWGRRMDPSWHQHGSKNRYWI